MQLYPGLNPFLQSVNSPINEKNFIPQSQNFTVANDSINPPPSPMYGGTVQNNYYNYQFQNGYTPISGFGWETFIPLDVKYPSYANTFKLGTIAGPYTGDGDDFMMLPLGITGNNFSITSGNGTLVFNITTASTPGSIIVNSSLTDVVTTRNTALWVTMRAQAKYTAFDTEGSAGTLSLGVAGVASSDGTHPYRQAPAAGIWSGSLSDFQSISLNRATWVSDNGGTIQIRLYARIPDGGAGTLIVKNVEYNLLRLAADT